MICIHKDKDNFIILIKDSKGKLKVFRRLMHDAALIIIRFFRMHAFKIDFHCMEAYRDIMILNNAY
jgi:hypothetical protein